MEHSVGRMCCVQGQNGASLDERQAAVRQLIHLVRLPGSAAVFFETLRPGIKLISGSVTLATAGKLLIRAPVENGQRRRRVSGAVDLAPDGSGYTSYVQQKGKLSGYS